MAAHHSSDGRYLHVVYTVLPNGEVKFHGLFRQEVNANALANKVFGSARVARLRILDKRGEAPFELCLIA
jgi:hypothetical protein